jgi:hypothetical protein
MTPKLLQKAWVSLFLSFGQSISSVDPKLHEDGNCVHLASFASPNPGPTYGTLAVCSIYFCWISKWTCSIYFVCSFDQLLSASPLLFCHWIPGWPSGEIFFDCPSSGSPSPAVFLALLSPMPGLLTPTPGRCSPHQLGLWCFFLAAMASPEWMSLLFWIL